MAIMILVGGLILALFLLGAALQNPNPAIKGGGAIGALLVLIVGLLFSSVRYVGEDSIGIVIKNVATADLPQGQIIATGGEKGPQAKILGPGWKFGYWPIIYDVETTQVVELREGEVGLITTRDGRPLPLGDIYAPDWSPDDFQQMQDAEYFLGDGQGFKGPQSSVLTPGKYRINPKLYAIEIVPVTNVEKATVGVIKSNVGDLATAATTTAESAPLVEKGQRGIWREPLLPQEYYLNTKAYEVTVISTAKRVIRYAGSDARSEQNEITVRTSDGFDFPVDVRLEYEIKPVDAPLVVAHFGDDKDNLRARLNSALRAIFRNNAESVKALDYVNQRSLQETQSLVMLAAEMTKVGVTVTAVRIAGVAEDGSLDTLLKTQTDRQIADEEVKTFKQQQLALEQKKAVTRTEQEAEEEKRLATAQYEVKIAEQEREKRIIEAGAEAEAIRIKAEAQAEAFRVIAEQIGPGNAALVELLKIVGDRGINITPRVMVISGQNGGGGKSGGGAGMASAETTALIGTMLDTMIEKVEDKP